MYFAPSLGPAKMWKHIASSPNLLHKWTNSIFPGYCHLLSIFVIALGLKRMILFIKTLTTYIDHVLKWMPHTQINAMSDHTLCHDHKYWLLVQDCSVLIEILPTSLTFTMNTGIPVCSSLYCCWGMGMLMEDEITQRMVRPISNTTTNVSTAKHGTRKFLERIAHNCLSASLEDIPLSPRNNLVTEIVIPIPSGLRSNKKQQG